VRDLILGSTRRAGTCLVVGERPLRQCSLSAIVHVIGQLAGVTAAPYIRSKQLVALLIDHMPDWYHYFVCFGKP